MYYTFYAEKIRILPIEMDNYYFSSKELVEAIYSASKIQYPFIVKIYSTKISTDFILLWQLPYPSDN